MPAHDDQVRQSLADLPTWMLILVSAAGLAGEMWRADVAGVPISVLVKRVALRSGASAVFGLSSAFIATECGSGFLTSMGLGAVVACLGADLVSGFYARWLLRKSGR